MKPRSDLDYIIVLGAHVNGTKLTLALLEGARRALLYLEENPGTKAVLSGGKGDGENISEAEAMYRYLTGHGINGDRLIREEESGLHYRVRCPCGRNTDDTCPSGTSQKGPSLS